MYVNSVHLIDYLTFYAEEKSLKYKNSVNGKNSKTKVSCKITFFIWGYCLLLCFMNLLWPMVN